MGIRPRDCSPCLQSFGKPAPALPPTSCVSTREGEDRLNLISLLLDFNSLHLCVCGGGVHMHAPA